MTSLQQSVVVDSNIVSYIARNSPIAEYYLPHLEGRRVVISFQTWEEVLYGAYQANWSDRRIRELEARMGLYEVQLPNVDLIRISARLRQQRRTAGRRLEPADAWIAATALYLGCPLATHDGDFLGIPNLQLITALSR